MSKSESESIKTTSTRPEDLQEKVSTGPVDLTSALRTPPRRDESGGQQRIDAAHAASRVPSDEPTHAIAESSDTSVRSQPEESASLTEQREADGNVTAAAEPTLAQMQQMRVQSGQLADYLDEMRSELDRRESQLNARTAETESHLRQARLWLQQQDDKLSEREESLSKSEAALSERTVEIDESQQKLTERGQNLDQRTADLERREAELAEQARQLVEQQRHLTQQQAVTESATARLQEQRQQTLAYLERERQKINRRRLESHELSRKLMRNVERRSTSAIEECERQLIARQAAAETEFEKQNQERLAEFEARQRLVDDAEALLAEGQNELGTQICHWQAQKLRDENHLQSERKKLAEEQREFEEQCELSQATLARRAEQLDAREAGQNQARARVASMHQETLETRLAIEELWSKLTAAVPQAKLVAELERIRGEVADHYHLERMTIEQERAQLESAEARLKSQHERLDLEKQDLARWIDRRGEEIERQAARLVAREQELDRRAAQLNEQSSDWDEERRAYQREVRSLLAELRGRGQDSETNDQAATEILFS